jgi:predicted nucleotidyltransferase
MAMPSFATSLAAEVRRLLNAGAPAGIVEVYLFGSVLTPERPHDVDVLIVWDEDVLAPRAAAELRPFLAGKLTTAVELPLHIILLSKREAAQSRFVEEERATRIYP